MLIDRNKIEPPTLRREAVSVPSLGGDVCVRGLKLSERLTLRGLARAGGNGEEFLAELLAICVVDTNGEPVFTAEQWDTFGSEHTAEYGELVDKAMSLGGFDGAAAKNG